MIFQSQSKRMNLQIKSSAGFHVELVSTPEAGAAVSTGDALLDRLRAPRTYALHIHEAGQTGSARVIPVAGRGGMRLARWQIWTVDGREVLSAYFEINAAGHDLDQWIHYDLHSGLELGRSLGEEPQLDTPAA